MPAITEYTLGTNAENLKANELSHYLQPVMLSQYMDEPLMQLFLALKTYNTDLYYTTIENVPADEGEKNDFPEDLGLLDDYKSMEAGERLVIVNGLAGALRGTAAETYTVIADVLMAVYTNSNTHADFVTEVPDADNIFDQLEADANTYIAYRYALADIGAVDFDTVKNQFKYNTVLAGALADQIVVPTTEGVATVLGDHFDEVVTMAQTSGKSADLVVALKKGIGDIGIDVLPELWLKTQEILQSDKVHLAEHHIYGSSRLGMQKYLPGELKFEYTIDPGANVFQGLTQSKPWYSQYGNDLFASTVYGNNLSTSTMGTTGMGINTHILGNRHYELTNHLGNVQATVVDRTTPVVNPTDGELEGYNADISTAQDYYPFGMYMPGRYLSDTDRHCVTVNSTIMVAKPVKLIAAKAQTIGLAYQVGADPAPPEIGNLPKATAFEDEVLHVYHYNSAELHPNGWVIHTDAAEGTVQYEIDLSDEPGEMYAYFQIHADTNQEVQPFGFNIELADGVLADMRVRQYYGGEEGYYELTEWTELTIGDHEVLLPINKSAVAAGGNTILEILFKSHDAQPFANGLKAILHNPYTFKTQMVPTNFVTTICDDEDDYRFGFNGQEKDNEVKGVGNSMDFGARIYDSRLGRFLSLDPLVAEFPGQSPYIFAGNSPIKFIDKNGELKIDPGIKKHYPLVYTYLSKQLEKDVEKSAGIYKAFMNRTNATKADIARDFKDNSGVGLVAVSAPGADDAFPSDGPEYYSSSKDAIEINERVLKYVEDKLANPKSTKLDKQQAILLLNIVLFHGEGHNLENKFGMNDKEHGKSYAGFEAGYDIEYMLYGLQPGHQMENEGKKDKIPGVRSKNDKLKEGVTEKIIEDAQGDENKTSNLPTVE